MSLVALPEDCLLQVCRYLQPTDTSNLTRVNRCLNAAVNNDKVWFDKLKYHFGMKWQEDWQKIATEAEAAASPPEPLHFWRSNRLTPPPPLRVTFARMGRFLDDFEIDTTPVKNNSERIQAEKGATLFKICLIGDSAVGKTSLLHRFCLGKFQNQYKSTIGVDFTSKMLRSSRNQEKKVLLQVWDIYGTRQRFGFERYAMRGTSGVLVCYDVTRRDTFTRLEELWTESLDQLLPDVCVVLVGLKSDMEKLRTVPTEEGRQFAAKMNWEFVEASNKYNVNVDRAFLSLSRQIQQKSRQKQLAEQAPTPMPAAKEEVGFFGWLKAKLGW